MNFRTLELNLAQLNRCIQKSRFNKYSDQRKAAYQKSITLVYEKLLTHDYSKLSKPELITKKSVLDFIFESIEYLDNSTLTVIPFEIVYCLEKALDEWIPANSYIVVTSLSNSLYNYSVKFKLALDPTVYSLIENDYGQKFTHRLIQITLPRYYVHDYLANVVLYHELGHFIDVNYKISETIVMNEVFNGSINYGTEEMYELRNHYMEYFADIFAAQYVGNASNIFLDYIAHKHVDTFSHPATDKRVEMVNKFLNGDYSPVEMTNLMSVTFSKTGLRLYPRFVTLSTDDFSNLLPYKLNNENELHSVFLAGWNAWQTKAKGILQQFDNETTYKAINNLIEKSISNYIVVENWK